MKSFPEIKEHFTVPEGYFDSFQERMTSMISEQPSAVAPDRKSVVVPITKRFWFRALSASASVALVVGSATTLWMLNNNTDVVISSADSIKSITTHVVKEKLVSDAASSVSVNEVEQETCDGPMAKVCESKRTSRKRAHQTYSSSKVSDIAAVDEVADFLLFDDQDIHQMIFESM